MFEVFPGVFRFEGRIATKSLAPGFIVYGEKTLKQKGVEYRLWEPSRSKLGAAIARGLKELPIRPGSSVLYLGAASGTTASHVSDIVGPNGAVYCIEFSARSMRDLIKVCEKRENMLPLLKDARFPKEYAEVGMVDVVFEDVADPEQARILIENAVLLKKGGVAMIAIKARCVSSTDEPQKVYAQVKKQLSSAFEITQEIDLAPFEEDHLFLVLKKK